MVVGTGVRCGREGHCGGGVEVVVIVLAGYLPFLLYLTFITFHTVSLVSSHFTSLFTLHLNISLTTLQQETGTFLSLLSLPSPFLPLSPPRSLGHS